MVDSIEIVLASSTAIAGYASISGTMLHHAWEKLQLGQPASALRTIACLARLPVPTRRTHSRLIEAEAYADLGCSLNARAAARELASSVALTGPCPWYLLASLANVFVNSGSYREVLELEQRWSEQSRKAGSRRESRNHAYFLLNWAEALDNLGQVEAAHQKIDEAVALQAKDKVASAGCVCSRAWLWVRAGDVERARGLLARIDPKSLGSRYESEGHYTVAVILLACGDVEAALRAADRGQAAAIRAASVRNGYFVRAECRLASGDHAEAVQLFESGLKHRYRRQGGYWLSLFAGVYASQGQVERANRVRELLALRDPEFRPRAAPQPAG